MKEIFNSDAAKEDIIRIGNNLAKYLFKNKIKNIIFIDCSARPGYIALKETWKNKFPDRHLPNIYFTNPEGYNTNKRDIEEIVNKFNTTYKKLSSNKKESIMIFDVCMHTGNTVKSILDVLKKAGYNNIFVGLAQKKCIEYSCFQKVNFVAVDYKPDRGCYPFSRDHIIEKSRRGNLVSSINDMFWNKNGSLILREELYSLFK